MAQRVPDKGIHKSIKELRAILGLTQEQFASKIGVTFSTVNRWETAKGSPSPLAMQIINELMKKHLPEN